MKDLLHPGETWFPGVPPTEAEVFNGVVTALPVGRGGPEEDTRPESGRGEFPQLRRLPGNQF